MWGILTSLWDEPIRNSNRGNWGRSFSLHKPFNLSNSFGSDLPKYRCNIIRIKTEHVVNKAHPGRWGAQLFEDVHYSLNWSEEQHSHWGQYCLCGEAWVAEQREFILVILTHWNHQKSLQGLCLWLWIRPWSSADVNPCISTRTVPG